VISVLLMLAFVLAACGGPTPSADTLMEKPTVEVMLEKPAESAMMDKPTEAAMPLPETPTPDAMVKPADGAMLEAPAWFGTALTNVNTGEAFTLNDLKGKVVLVETMAIWCPKCKSQQNEVKALRVVLDNRDDLVLVALDIDPNESPDMLREYAQSNGFDWFYAVPPAEVSREIATLYGDQFLNPPSTPMLIIDRKGVAHPLPFGIKSAEELLEMLKPFLDEAM
jgi:thiol-disulfide isomerase/thioredoxin